MTGPATQLAIGAAIAVVSVLSGCIGSPTYDKSALRSLDRVHYAVQVEQPEGVKTETDIWSMSALRTGSPDLQRVIYIHGTPADATFFIDYLVEPVPGYESISIDRAGFGQSSPVAPLTSFAQQAATVEPLLVQRSGRWPILVGHSLGGPIAARIAADFPDRVDALVILGGSLDPELEAPRWYNHVGNWLVVRPFIGYALKHSNAELFAAVTETKRLAEVLDRVTCPVIIMHGTGDRLVPFANVAFMEAAFCNAPVRTVAIKDAGHFFPWHHEQLVRHELLALQQPGVQPPGAINSTFERP